MPSTELISSGQTITNYSFGNKCIICGGFFNECGICANFHEYDKVYYYPPGKNPKKFSSKPVNLIICNIRFLDNEDICQNEHVIGWGYYKR